MISDSPQSIPLGWELNQINDICALLTDGSHFSPTPHSIGCPIANVKDMRDGYIDLENCTKISEKDFQKLKRNDCGIRLGDVLLSKDGTIGKVVVYSQQEEIVALSSIAILRPVQGVDSRYLGHALQSPFFNKQIEALKSGSALRRIILRDIASLVVPKPPLSEQRGIAEFLDTVDEAIQKTEALVAKLKAMKAGLLHDLLARGLNGHGQLRDPIANPERFKDSPLGSIPREWEITPLEKIADIVMGQSPPGHSYNKVGEGVPLINGPVEYGDRHPIKIQWTTSPTKLCKPGDVLLCVRGSTTGRLNIADDTFCIGRGIAAIRGGAGSALTGFIELFLKKLAEQILSEAKGSGSTFPNITSERLSKTRILLPSLNEQEIIVSILISHDTRIRTEETYLNKLKLQKKGLMHDLLTGKVRTVELTTQDDGR
jgi:type I restriction enzyme S subunit